MGWRETGQIVGSEHLAKGISKVLDYLDSATGKATAPFYQRPSFWASVAGGALLVVVPRLLKRVPSWADVVMTALGGFLTTRAWDYLEEALAAGGGGGAGASPTYAPTSYVPASPAPAPAPAPALQQPARQAYVPVV